MNIETTYEPTETLEDHFLPIDRTVWHIHTDQSQEAAKEAVHRFKQELSQKREPSQPSAVQHVYVPVPVPDCLVDNSTDTPSWSRSQEEVRHPYQDEHEVMRRIKKRIAQIEKIDRRTWGLYYGAQDVWSIISRAFIAIFKVLGAIRSLAAARIRNFVGRKMKQLSVSISNERQENREARSGRASETR